MKTNRLSSDDFPSVPSTMKYKDLPEAGDTNIVSNFTPAQTRSRTPIVSRWSCTQREKVLFVLFGVLIMVVFGFGIATVYNLKLHSELIYPISCKDALAKGNTASGLVKIMPKNSVEPFQVYCDMSSAGGGWTMVSSIHEDFALDSCGVGDRWSSQTSVSSNIHSAAPFGYFNDIPNGGEERSSEGYSNWKNLLTFGTPNTATSTDYKSEAYFSVAASNLMIWHVPNDVPLTQISNMAYFKYYTNSNFLSNYGKTLKTLYTKYAPLKRLQLNGILERLIPCFPSTWPQNISANRSSMVPTSSNPITISLNDGNYTNITPGMANNVSEDINITTSITNTSTTVLVWVSNTDRMTKSIKLRINGYSARSRYLEYYETHSNINFRYNYFCNGSSCKIVYYIGSPVVWGTVVPIFKVRQISDSTCELSATKMMQSFIIGYSQFRKSELVNPTVTFMKNMFKTLTTCLGKIEMHDLTMNQPISTPAIFVKGNMADYTKNVTPGFIEFRRYDSYGYPYALCPGIKVKKGVDPALYCVGSFQTHYSVMDRCGDFSAWNQLAAHNKKRVSQGIQYTDLTSSILLFTR